MTQDQWSLVESHFEALADLQPADRTAGLTAIGDEEVRREVSSLLEHSGGGETVSSVVGAMADHVESGEIGDRRIGPYKLVRRLGQGGQGAVFEAVRDDGTFHQRVAIKIVKWEIDSGDARNRFRHERQILAGLEHPHIARLLDGGETSEGTPYLVMEFVDGLPLTAATQGWPLLRKLELFLEVAAAVASAHRNLIVHRDLKPANIMVTKDGTPKLLDFGIAKLLDENAQRTMTGFQALTPDYASPEQVRGEPITTACDVYSLGVVLYELLAGRRPYNAATLSPADIVKAVCLTEPPPLRLSEDLDNIVRMAMRKEPARRYASVEQFAQDIQRTLEHRPVLARKDTFRYRTGKFMRRNALALGAAAAIFLALTGGAAVALQQARIAGQRFEQVRRLAHSFVFDFTDDLAKLEGTTAVREKMVRTALEYLDNLSKSAGGDVELQKELAAAYRKVGDAQGVPTLPNLGHTDQAIASYRKAADIHERIAARDPLHRHGLGVFYTEFAYLLLHSGDLAGAKRIGESALSNLEQAAREHPGVTDRRVLARAWCMLGKVDAEPNHYSPALIKYRKCDAIAREMLAGQRNIETLQAAVFARQEIGTAATATGRLEEALTAFDEVQALLEELLRLEPSNPKSRRALALLGQDRSQAWYDDAKPNRNDPAQALKYARQYRDAMQQMVARDGKDQSARLSLAIALFRLSFPLKHSDPPGAVASARESVRIFDDLIAEGRNSYLVLSRRNRALRRLSEALLFAGNAAEARVRAADALSGQRQIAARDTKNLDEAASLAMTLAASAEAAEALHDVHGANDFLMEAESIAAGIYSLNPNELTSVIPLARIREELGGHWRKAGGQTQSRRWFEDARKLWRDYPDQNDFVRRESAALAARAGITNPPAHGATSPGQKQGRVPQ